MTPTFTLVTPTADQPTGIALCERFMAAQTIDVRQFQWIVVDDGVEPARLTMGQEHIRRQREPECKPAQSFCRNLIEALPRVMGDWIVFIEHDDFYKPGHLELLAELTSQKGALIAGDGIQRYYNVIQRSYRVFENYGACLCQTAIATKLRPNITKVIEGQLAKGKYGVDASLWRDVQPAKWALKHAGTALGIKGLPGRPGLGLGHRPTTDGKWRPDPALAMLRTWIGDAAEIYAPFSADEIAKPKPAAAAAPSHGGADVPLLDAHRASVLLGVDAFGLLKLVRAGKIEVARAEKGRHFFAASEVDRIRQQLNGGGR
jgi:glycosyltransferase involved in cell wall biosynthesis